MKKILSAVLVSAMLASAAMAAPAIDGMTSVDVKSCYSKTIADTTAIFDGLEDTYITIEATEDAPASIEIAALAPFQLTSVAVQAFSETISECSIFIYGSMDAENWDNIEFESVYDDETAFSICTPVEDTENYFFYRLVIYTEDGSPVDIADIAFYRADGDWMIPEYNTETGEITGWKTYEKEIVSKVRPEVFPHSNVISNAIRKSSVTRSTSTSSDIIKNIIRG